MTQFATRRRQLSERFDDTVFVLTPTATETWSPNAYYLSGIEQGALVCFATGAVLFTPERDARNVRFDGPLPSRDAIGQIAEIDDVRPLSQLSAALPALLREGRRVAYRVGSAWDADVLRALSAASRSPTGGLRDLVDPNPLIGELRLRKDALELEAMRNAAKTTAAVHAQWPSWCADKPTGRQLAARIEAEGICRGGRRRAYYTIVAIDDEALTLHCSPSDRVVRPDSTVLVDAGFEVDHYACDITRTECLSATSSQADVHDAVARAQHAALRQARPGATIDDVHEAAVASLTDSLRMLAPGMSIDDVFMHRTSHWIGLEVHDPGPSSGVALEPGMTFTVEPGLYFGDEAPCSLRGIGVRIEDVVAITDDGHENLTRN